MGTTFTPRDLAKWSWSDAIQGARAGRVAGVHAEVDRELRKTYFSGAMDTSRMPWRWLFSATGKHLTRPASSRASTTDTS